MTKTTLLAAASALVLTASAASAAITESAVNMRSGPGTQYDVVTTLPGGARFDVSNCNGAWCQGSFQGRSGFVSSNYLDFGGEGPAPVVVAPQVYDDYGYDDYPAYGPGFGYYNGPSWRYRQPGQWNRPRPGRPPMAGRPGRPFVVDRPGRPGMNRPPSVGFPRQGGPRVGAPAGMPRGASPGFAGPARGAAPAPAAPSAAPSAPGGPVGFGR